MQPQTARSLDALGAGLTVMLCALWGIQQVGTKIAAEQGLSPLVQAGIRSAGAAVLVCAWVALRQGRAGLRATLRLDANLVPGLAVGVFFTLEFLCLFEGVARTTASHAVLLLYTAPFFTAAGAHVFLPGEKLNAVQLAGLVCAFGGVALSTGGGAGMNLGDGLVLAAAALWGATTITIRSTSLASESAARVLLWQLVPSGVTLLAIAVAIGGFAGAPGASKLAWASLSYQTVIVAFASYLVWFWLLTRYSPRVLSAFTLLTPLLGIAAGALVLHERVSPLLIVAFVLVATGLRLVNGPVRTIARGSA